MATIDRFKEILDKGGFAIDGKFVPLTAQLKYDCMAAVHTMEEILSLAAEIQKRNHKRDKLREKISNSFKLSLKKFVEDEEAVTLKKIDAAIQGLHECRRELLKIESAGAESDKLAEFIRGGITAGR